MEDTREQGKKHNPRDIQEQPDARDAADSYRTPTLHDADLEDDQTALEDRSEDEPQPPRRP